MPPISKSPEHIGTVAGERTVKRVNPRKVSTRKVPVIFDPRVAGSLIGHLASAANGASVARKSSFLREKLGEQIFASRHPHHRRSAVSCAGSARIPSTAKA